MLWFLVFLAGETVQEAHERDREVAVANAALNSLAGAHNKARSRSWDQGLKQEPTRLIN